MQITDAIYRRRAVRAYRDDPVKTDVIEALIEAAIQAPSAMNRQPWRFTVVCDRKLLDSVSQRSKAHMLENLPADGGEHHFQEMLSNPEFQIFYHAPVLIVISAVTNGPWAIEDCSLAAQNLMLAACAHGLGSCWIGFAQGWLQTPEGKAALQIDSGWLPVAPIIVGHPAGETPPVERNRPDIHWLGGH
jgi:nitroreductase